MNKGYKAADTLRPGDIWRHKGLGLLAVTDEEPDRYPGHLKCYWMMGGNHKAPWTFMDPKRTKEFTLVSRMDPDGATITASTLIQARLPTGSELKP